MGVRGRCRWRALAPIAWSTALVAGLVMPRASAQVITQVLDASGAGPDEPLLFPVDVVVDGGGNVYVSGAATDNVLKLTPSGQVSAIIDELGDLGNGGNEILFVPTTLAVDHWNNVYVSGGHSANVFKITPGGSITAIINFDGDGLGNTLDGPQDVCLDNLGNVYVTGSSSDNTFKIAMDGTVTEILDATGDGAGHGVFAPVGVAADHLGNVFVASALTHTIFKIAVDGTVTPWIVSDPTSPSSPFAVPLFLATDHVGNVYVTAGQSTNVVRISPSGIITQIIGPDGDGQGNELRSPNELIVDTDANVYVSGANSNNVFRITPSGEITEIIDQSGDGQGHELRYPRGLALGPAGSVYVVGSESDNVFRIDQAECFLVVGDAPGSASWSPSPVAHSFTTQVSQVESWHPVLLDDIPEFVLPSPAASPPLRSKALAAAGPAGGSSPPLLGQLHPAVASAAPWEFAVQVVMWNPQVFPQLPEQHTHGLAVKVFPNGRVVTTPYGTSQGGMTIWAETDVNAQGQKVLRFPFSIPGF